MYDGPSKSISMWTTNADITVDDTGCHVRRCEATAGEINRARLSGWDNNGADQCRLGSQRTADVNLLRYYLARRTTPLRTRRLAARGLLGASNKR